MSKKTSNKRFIKFFLILGIIVFFIVNWKLCNGNFEQFCSNMTTALGVLGACTLLLIYVICPYLWIILIPLALCLFDKNARPYAFALIIVAMIFVAFGLIFFPNSKSDDDKEEDDAQKSNAQESSNEQ